MSKKSYTAKHTRMVVPDPVTNNALKDIYDKLDALLVVPLNPGDGSISTEPQEAEATSMSTTDSGNNTISIFHNNEWWVDTNANFVRATSKSLNPTKGVDSRDRRIMPHESLKYNKSGNIKIQGKDNTKVILKSLDGVLKIRNAADSADAILKAKRLQVDTETSGTGSSVKGEFQFDSAGPLFYLHGKALAANSFVTGDIGDNSSFLTISNSADAIYRCLDGSTNKWVFGYDHTAEEFTDATCVLNGTTTVSFTHGQNMDTHGIKGAPISGTGIDSGTYISSINKSANTLVLTKTATVSGTQTLTSEKTDGRFKIDNHAGGALQEKSELSLDDLGALELFGTSASLKLSYNADDYATMSVADTGDLTIATIGDGSLDSKLILDVDGSVEINADAGTIYLKDDDYEFARIKNTLNQGTFYLYPAADASDYLLISSGDNGAASITTTATGTLTTATLNIQTGGTFTIDSGADIVLDAYSGSFIAKNAGTEFSVASSAYAGMILGYRGIGEDVIHSSYTLTTGYVVPNVNMTVRFKAPPSGAVEVFVQIWHNASTSNKILYLGLSDNATYNTIGVQYEQVARYPDETDDNLITHRWFITGLTPGATLNYWLGAKTSGTNAYLNWGGNGTGRYPDFIMKVTALPKAVSDFAVYD